MKQARGGILFTGY